LKVRSLEAQNRHLADELAKLKSKWGKETAQVKAMYETELDEARQAFDEVGKEKARLEVRATTLEDLTEELRAKSADFLTIYPTKLTLWLLLRGLFSCSYNVRDLFSIPVNIFHRFPYTARRDTDS